MNTQTTDPPLSHEELKKKLEIRLVRIESQKANYTRAADSYRSDGIEGGALVNEMEAAKFDEEIFLLRSCLTALERGEQDAKILDAMDKHIMYLSHTRATCSVMMCGTTIHGQFENLDRANGGGSFRKVKGRNIREAVLSAIATTNQQEGE